MKKIIAGSAIALAALSLSACGITAKGNTAGYSQPGQDAPVSNQGHEDMSPAEVVAMPDGFSNFSDKCNHGNRVYVVYHGYANGKTYTPVYAAIAVVPHDPTCPQGH